MRHFRQRLSFAAALIASAAPLSAQTFDSTTLAGLRWRNVGPANFGGRVSDVAGIPSPSKTFYVASAAGGIWKTTNAGITFKPIFDNQRVVAMGMLAIAPSDTQQVWAGTGEPNSRNTIEPGGGVFKSTDGGATWKLMGLEKTQHIGRIVVHPTNPNVVYVAAVGAAWKSNPERGLYKTEDGGATWKLIKFIDDSTGFIDVAMDPSNPEVLYASAYQRIRGPYFLFSGGKGSGLWKTTDGGATWNEIKGGGFPETKKGRIGLAIARSNPNVVYALVEADTMPNAKPAKGSKPQTKSGLYRSEDAGKSWSYMNDQDTRPFYYSQVRVDPKNPNRVYWSSTPVLFSDDGGKTARTATGGIHVDHHAMWIDPNDPEHIIVGDDGGVSQSWDRGGNYQFLNVLPIGQFYAVSYDFAVPYNICGGAQDNGTWCGPSRRQRGGVPNSYWFTYAFGDGFWTAQDPLDPKIIYGESQGGNITRTNLATGQSSFLFANTGYGQRYRQWEDSIVLARPDTTVPMSREIKGRIEDLRSRQHADSAASILRFNWETPYFLSSHNHEVFYSAGNRVFKSTKRGDDLFPISPDLSKQQRDKIDISVKTTGGITNDATGAETYGTVVAFAESYVKPGILYAGTDDGNVWYTINDGAAWTQVDWKKFPGLPNNEVYVSRIEPSHFDTLTWYVSFDNHRTNDFTPYLFVTSDGGKTFSSLAATLPTGGPDYVRVVREDPVNRDLLFAGTSVGAYVSPDRGKHWQKFMAGMPTVPVFDLKIHPRDHELIAATHGRNFFIVNVAPLEQMAGKEVAGAKLFEPAHFYGWGEGPVTGTSANGEGQGVYASPAAPYGADIYYYLPADAPKGGAKVRIQDVSGDTLATFNASSNPGLQHVTWNLRGTKPRRDLPALSPSARRDSIGYYTRTAAALDSVAKAGWDTALVRHSREMLISPIVVSVNFDCGGAPSGAVKLDPNRPAEGGVVRGGNNACSLDIGGSKIECDKWMDLQRVINPKANIQPGACFTNLGGNRNTNSFIEAAPGDYLVTMTIGDKTYRQTLRVDKVGAGEVRVP